MELEGRSFPASSFHPPAVLEGPHYPGWALLDTTAYFADCENATTAEAVARTGRIVKVTFCLAEPPAVSHFCVYGAEFKHEDVLLEPRVVSSEKDLVLLNFLFTRQGCYHGEYFIYKAGHGKPSLTPIPAMPTGTSSALSISIVPCDEEGFFLADLFVTTTLGHYDPSIFSSKTATWTTRTLALRSSTAIMAVDMFVETHKVISLGGGLVGWVDLWRGIIAYNILDKDPFIYFIPLPKPEFNLPRSGDPELVRDITCCNGVIKFVEMDHIRKREDFRISKRFKVTKDLDSVDVMHDQEILLLQHEDFLEAPMVPDGWKIRTCYRHISWRHWRRGHVVHVDEILASDPGHSVLLPQLLDSYVRRSGSEEPRRFLPHRRHPWRQFGLPDV